MSFTAAGYSVDGGSSNSILTLSDGSGQIDAAAGSSASISAVISSENGIFKTGTGSISVAATTNATTAATLNVQQGSLTISASQTWQTIDVAAGANLTLSGSSSVITASSGVTVDGFIDHEAGLLEVPALTVDGGGTFHNAGGSLSGSVGNVSISNAGLFEVLNDQSLATATGSFVNTGTLEVDNATGSGTTTSSMSFTNSGTIDVTAGTFALSGSLTLPSGSTTTLIGAGTLTVPVLDDQAATVLQNGGNLTVNGQLSVGSHFLTGASWTLNAGTLNTQTFYVGIFATGTFLQTGGTLNTGHTEIGSYGNGTLSQTGGTSNFYDMYFGFNGTGTFDLSGGSATAYTIVDGQFGTGTINLSGSAALNATAAEALGQAGGIGYFTQSGTSTNTTYAITVGSYGASGNYTLQGGTLSNHFESVGYAGSAGNTGIFTQTGGLNACWYMTIGSGTSTAVGQYNLSGGTYDNEILFEAGFSGGQGAFIQSGGTSLLKAGLFAGVNATSSLILVSGGSMSVTGNAYVGFSSAATFAQSGGTVGISGTLYVSGDGWDGDPAGVGTAQLSSSGQLSDSFTYVGYTASGSFTQTGGTHITNAVVVDGPTGTIGTYNQSGGTLEGVTTNGVMGTVSRIDVLKPSISGGSVVAEGSPYTLGLSATSVGGNDFVTYWNVVWGDGNSNMLNGNPSSTQHTYYTGGNSYTINATAHANSYAFPTNTQTVIVTDVPASVAAIADQAVNCGSSLSISTTFTDPGTTETHTANIDWGDGTVSSATVTESNGSGSISASHTYLVHGNYTPSLAVTDSKGAVGISAFNVHVAYVAPILSMGLSSDVVVEGKVAIFSLNSSGPERTGITSWDIDWGDGTPIQHFTDLPGSVTSTVASWTLQHEFQAEGDYNVQVTGNDSMGGHTLSLFGVTAIPTNSVALSVALVANSITAKAVTLSGDAGSDRFYVRWLNGNVQIFQNSQPTSDTDPGDPVYSGLAADLAGVTINGGGGEDRLTIDYSNVTSVGTARPFGLAGLTFNSGTSNNLDPITLIGGTDSTTDAPDQLTINGSTATQANSIVFTAESGSGYQPATVFASNSVISIDMPNGDVSVSLNGHANAALMGETPANIAANLTSFSTLYVANAAAESDLISETTDSTSQIITNLFASAGAIQPDSLTLDDSATNPIPSSGLAFAGPEFTIVGPSDSSVHNIVITATSTTLDGNTITYLPGTIVDFEPGSAATSITIAGGTANIDSDVVNDAPLSIEVSAGGNVVFESSLHLAGLTIDAGGTARLAPVGNLVLDINPDSLTTAANVLTISPPNPSNQQSGGVLDLSNNDMIVRRGSIDSLTNLLAAGFANTHWNGIDPTATLNPASILSTIVEFEPNYEEALGVGLVGQSNVAVSGTFDNQPVAAGDVVVKFTFYGDANLDGKDDGSDYASIDYAYAHNLSGWANGDFNYNGVIDGEDYALMDNGFNEDYALPSITLAANENFPVNQLPTHAANQMPIASWRVDWGNGNTQTFGPTDSIANPYPDTDATYQVAMTALGTDGNPIYYYPHMNLTVARIGPTNLAAVAATSPDEVDLSWTGYDTNNLPSTDIYISTDGTNFSYFDSVQSSQTSYRAKGLLADTHYTFEVVTTDNSGDESSPSNTASSTTAIDPWDVTVTGASTIAEGGSYELVLSTNPISTAPAFGNWTIDWGDGTTSSPDIQTVSTADTTVSHTFIAGTTSTMIQVTASTASGAALPLSVTTPPISVDVIPTAPSNLVATIYSSTEVDLSWTNNSQSATGYNILRSDDGGATYNVIDTVDGDADTYSDTTLTPSQSVQYEVQAAGDPDNPDDVSDDASSPVETTPSGQPSLHVAQAADHSDSAALTWTYQGNDASGFEIEEEDVTIGENFHTILTPGPVGSSGTDTATVPIVGGDNYNFRIRADHTDGTVSDYTSRNIQIIQADAPDLQLSIVDQGINIAWSGAADSVQIEVRGDAYPGDTQWYYSADRGDYYITSTDGSGSVLNLGVGGTGDYSYRIQSHDQYGNPTKWSDPQDIAYTDAGPDPEPDSLDLTSTDTSITATWPADSGASGVIIMQQKGVDTEIGYYSATLIGNLNADGTEYSTSPGNLHPGTQYDFLLATENGGGISYTKESISTSGTPNIAPVAPDLLVATLLLKPFEVALHWHNTPNNEDQYILQSSTNSNFSTILQTIQTGGDETSTIDTHLKLGRLYYRVEALKNGISSSWTTTSVFVHYTIKLQFNAFIPKSLGRPGIPAEAWNWGVEPVQTPGSTTYFGTDDRENAGDPGTSRIHTEIDIDSSAIGNSQDNYLEGVGVDSSHKATGNSVAGGIQILSEQAANGSIDVNNISSLDPTSQSTDIHVYVEGSYPFGIYAPPIIINVTWHLVVQPDARTSVAVDGETSAFPAYEGLLNGTVIYSSKPPPGAGPGLLNLGLTGAAIAVRGAGSAP